MSLSRESTQHPVIHLDHLDDWDILLSPELCGDALREPELDQFKKTLGASCKTIVVERNYVCKDYRDTFSNYYSKKFRTYPDKCTRLLFFRDRMETDEWWEWWDSAEHRQSFIGYTVIRPNRIRCIGRTVLDPSYCAGVSGDMCLTLFKVNFLGVELEVCGFPYISQDAEVNICAHAACWMCFRYFTERYPSYQEIYPYQINQLTQNLSYGRLVPSQGLTLAQIAEIFSRFGFFPRVYTRQNWDIEQDRERFNRLLYSYIESGIPLVLELPKPKHAVAAIGHISDYTKAPKDGLTYSSHYVTGLIINDDNSLPYQALPRRKGELQGHVSVYTLDQVASFVVPLYEKIILAAEDIERLTETLLRDSEFGLEATSQPLRAEELVVRIFLTSSRAYKQERRKAPPPYGLDRLYTELPMPKFVWVSELALKGAHSQKIVGEILWDSTASPRDHYAWLVIHYPERLAVNDRTSIGGKAISTPLEQLQEYDVYTHNLHPIR